MNSGEKDLYRILGLNDNAEFAVIKAAYKALIMIYHPDRYANDRDKAIKLSKEINEAYAVLIDPEKRKKYDAGRSGQSQKTSNKSERTMHLKNELNKTLQESEAILKILNSLD